MMYRMTDLAKNQRMIRGPIILIILIKLRPDLNGIFNRLASALYSCPLSESMNFWNFSSYSFSNSLCFFTYSLFEPTSSCSHSSLSLCSSAFFASVLISSSGPACFFSSTKIAKPDLRGGVGADLTHLLIRQIPGGPTQLSGWMARPPVSHASPIDEKCGENPLNTPDGWPDLTLACRPRYYRTHRGVHIIINRAGDVDNLGFMQGLSKASKSCRCCRASRICLGKSITS